MKKHILLLFIILGGDYCEQDVQFAQSTFVHQLIKPATIGVINDW